MNAPARWPCHYCLRRPRREPSSWALVALLAVTIAGACAVAIINLGASSLR